MSRKAPITQADITRSLRAAEKAGKRVAAMMLRDGELRLVFANSPYSTTSDGSDWDEVLNEKLSA